MLTKIITHSQNGQKISFNKVSEYPFIADPKTTTVLLGHCYFRENFHNLLKLKRMQLLTPNQLAQENIQPNWKISKKNSVYFSVTLASLMHGENYWVIPAFVVNPTLKKHKSNLEYFIDQRSTDMRVRYDQKRDFSLLSPYILNMVEKNHFKDFKEKIKTSKLTERQKQILLNQLVSYSIKDYHDTLFKDRFAMPISAIQYDLEVYAELIFKNMKLTQKSVKSIGDVKKILMKKNEDYNNRI
jgi:hypothetical protein